MSHYTRELPKHENCHEPTPTRFPNFAGARCHRICYIAAILWVLCLGSPSFCGRHSVPGLENAQHLSRLRGHLVFQVSPHGNWAVARCKSYVEPLQQGSSYKEELGICQGLANTLAIPYTNSLAHSTDTNRAARFQESGHC